MAKLIDRHHILHDHYHIAKINQLSEVPSSIVHRLSFVLPALSVKLKECKPGDLIDLHMWGQPMTMTYEVCQYLVVTYALEHA